jgi:hypothetical protein
METHRIAQSRSWLFAAGVVVVAAGCRGTSVCDPSAGPARPPGTVIAAGHIVRTEMSEEYFEQLEKGETGAPHIACRAETTIATAKRYLRYSEQMTHGIVYTSRTAYDNRVVTPFSDTNMTEGEFRVTGLGYSLDVDDCSRLALLACEDAVTGYFQSERAVRPPAVLPCRLMDVPEHCAVASQ